MGFFYSVNDLDAAAAAFRQAAIDHPDAAAAHNNLAHVLHQQRHYEEALTSARQAVALAACRTLVVDSENRPHRGRFLPDSPPHGCSMGQEAGKKGAGAVDLQPTIPKSDRLPGGPLEDAARGTLAEIEASMAGNQIQRPAQ